MSVRRDEVSSKQDLCCDSQLYLYQRVRPWGRYTRHWYRYSSRVLRKSKDSAVFHVVLMVAVFGCIYMYRFSTNCYPLGKCLCSKNVVPAELCDEDCVLTKPSFSVNVSIVCHIIFCWFPSWRSCGYVTTVDILSRQTVWHQCAPLYAWSKRNEDESLAE